MGPRRRPRRARPRSMARRRPAPAAPARRPRRRRPRRAAARLRRPRPSCRGRPRPRPRAPRPRAARPQRLPGATAALRPAKQRQIPAGKEPPAAPAAGRRAASRRRAQGRRARRPAARRPSTRPRRPGSRPHSGRQCCRSGQCSNSTAVQPDCVLFVIRVCVRRLDCGGLGPVGLNARAVLALAPQGMHGRSGHRASGRCHHYNSLGHSRSKASTPRRICRSRGPGLRGSGAVSR